MDKREGISGLTGAFKDALVGIDRGAKLAFVGSVGVCVPFAELLAYSVRDKEFEMSFVPMADLSKARRMGWVEGIGYSVLDEKREVSDADVIVILGGLAVPKFGCQTRDISDLINALSRRGRPKVIGVCFMSIFKKSGWEESLPFDSVIDATMEVSTI